MDTLLVGYLLNALDEAERLQAEDLLRRDAAAAGRLEALRRMLAPLESDREDAAPPTGLAIRTLAHIAEYNCRTLPAAPVLTRQEAVPARAWWRRLDVLVAACLLLTAFGLGVPYVLRQRALADRSVCGDRLKTFGEALARFHDTHRAFPDVNAEGEPRNVAGMMVPLLQQAGSLPADAALHCPGGPIPARSLTLANLRALAPEEFRRWAPSLNPTYAYSLGYRDAAGHHGPRRETETLGAVMPLMADLPPEGLEGNSPNHGGRGQNVLYHDGHVRFVTDRGAGFGSDDIYLNRNRQVGAGLDLLDAVLGSSGSRP